MGSYRCRFFLDKELRSIRETYQRISITGYDGSIFLMHEACFLNYLTIFNHQTYGDITDK